MQTVIKNKSAQPPYDAVAAGWRSFFIALSPLLAIGLALYTLTRGPQNLLFDENTLKNFRWFAVLPLDVIAERGGSAFFIQGLLVSNAFAVLTIIIAIPFVLAPRPIMVQRYGNQLCWQAIKLVIFSIACFVGKILLVRGISVSSSFEAIHIETKIVSMYLLIFFINQFACVSLVVAVIPAYGLSQISKGCLQKKWQRR